MSNLNSENIEQLFLFFLIIKLITQLYLNLRNKNHILKHRNHVPELFKEKISNEDHLKAARYSVEKGAFGRFNLILDTIFLYIWTVGGGLNFIDQWGSQFFSSSIERGVFLLASLGLISLIVGIPTSLYSNFYIEEKYGFNKMTYKTFFTDTLKQIFLGALFGLPLFVGLIYILEMLGKYWWVYAWAFLTLFQFLLMWIYPTFIAPLFNKFKPLEEGEIKETVNKLANKVDFAFKEIFVMNASMRSSHGNAYFTGFGKNKRIVFFDTLLETLTPQEVEAVLAHELGHFKCKHIIKMLTKSLVLSLIGFFILGKLAETPIFFQGHGVAPSSYMTIILFSMVSGVYTFLMTPISSSTSRKYEYEADAFAAKHSRPQELINALVKMYKDNASTLTPDPLFTKWYMSHPPALERTKHLQTLMDN